MEQVFLGGSCNPTTWRTDFAIPLLQSKSIPIFNPQTDVWRPELINIEHEAKEKSKYLFFTIDNQTRSVVSIIECAYLAGNNRNLVLVIKKIDDSDKICEENISNRELQDIRCGQTHLQNLALREMIPTFSSIKPGLDHLIEWIDKDRNNNWYQNHIDNSDPRISKGDRFLRLIYDTMSNNTNQSIVVEDVKKVMEFIAETSITERRFEIVAKQVLGQVCMLKPYSEFRKMSVSFEQFQSIVKMCLCKNDIQNESLALSKIMDFINVEIFHRIIINLGKLFGVSQQESIVENQTFRNLDFLPKRNVYLGGSCDKTDWREKIAIPFLRNNNVSYFNPLNSSWSEKMILTELEVIETCDIILFVITGETRSLAVMTLAAYYIGKTKNVVLHVQDMVQNCLVAGEILSKKAVDDYNRGRAYLKDMAAKNDVKVYDTIEKSIEAVIKAIQ